jgi:hypothetical protein
MTDFLDASPRLLTAANIALGLVCLAFLTTVAVAVWRDVRERRRWRAMIPEGWPPRGR